MINIREANINDVNGIANVHVRTWKSTYKGIVNQSYLDRLSVDKSIDNNLRVLKNNTNLVYVAINVQQEIIGFVVAGDCRDKSLGENLGEIYGIYVLKEHSNKGIGKRLLSIVFDKFLKLGKHSVVVDFLAGNEAEKFYYKLGARYLSSKPYKIGGLDYLVHTYIWEDLNRKNF
jgi:ribosomal protein S18 acetylase RimI-like enzyme